MGETRGSRRAGRARIGDLFLYDLILLLVVVGLLWAERELARSADAAEQRPATTTTTPPTPPPPTTTTPTTTTAPDRPVRPVRVTTEAAPPADGDGAASRREVERVVSAARAAADAGRLDEALAALAGADAGLRAGAAWTELAAPLADALAEQVAAQDAWRAVLPDVQVLADAGDLQGVEALLPRGGAAPLLARERDRARARAGARPGGGFQIRGFTPDEERVDGRRCSVEGPLERARLLEVRDAVDALLAQAEAALEAGLQGKLVVKVLAEDAAAQPASALAASTHLRADDAPGDLVARARLLAARAVVAAVAPRATPGARDALVHALAGAEPSGRDPRPHLTALGQTWRRRALAGASADALGAAWTGAPAPELSFALGFAALWGGPAGEPLRRALAAARDGRAAPLGADDARALANALPTLLETP